MYSSPQSSRFGFVYSQNTQTQGPKSSAPLAPICDIPLVYSSYRSPRILGETPSRPSSLDPRQYTVNRLHTKDAAEVLPPCLPIRFLHLRGNHRRWYKVPNGTGKVAWGPCSREASPATGLAVVAGGDVTAAAW